MIHIPDWNCKGNEHNQQKVAGFKEKVWGRGIKEGGCTMCLRCGCFGSHDCGSLEEE